MDQRIIDIARDALLFPVIRWSQLSGLFQLRLRCSLEEADLFVDALAHDGHISIGRGSDPSIVAVESPVQIRGQGP